MGKLGIRIFLCVALLSGMARAEFDEVVGPAPNSALTPSTARYVADQGGFDWLLAVWGGEGWTGVSPRYVTCTAAVAKGIVSDKYLLERVTSFSGKEVYRVQCICAATANEPGFNLDTFENNWEHPRYVLYPGEGSDYAYSNIFAFAMSDIHWTRWGARATYHPLPDGGEAGMDLRQPLLQVQSVIVTNDIPYGSSADEVSQKKYQWDPVGDFFKKTPDEARYNYGIGNATADNVRTGEIVSNWVPSVIWKQDLITTTPTGVPTYRFEYNMGGIFEFDELGDNPVLHVNEVAFFRVLKTDIERHVNDVFEKWPKDTDGDPIDLVDENGFETYSGDVNNPNDPAYPGFAILNDKDRPWVVQHDPFRGNADKETDPDANWDTVAGTEGFYDPDPSKYVPAVTSSVTIAVSGPGTLKWKNLIQDPSKEKNAAVWVSVDGGTPQRMLAGDMEAWSDQYQIFDGSDAGEGHTVTISFVNNTNADPSQTAYGYLDNVVWETLSTSLMIVDHEDPGDGFVYLAFKPERHGMRADEPHPWAKRLYGKTRLRAKCGRTRFELETSASRPATYSDKPEHVGDSNKIWVKVDVHDFARTNSFWRVYVDEPQDDFTDDVNPSEKVRPPLLRHENEKAAESVNVFGIVRVESLATNTLVAIPWTWYSAQEKNAQHIFANKLVKTTNLRDGDWLYVHVEDDGEKGHYAAWVVENGRWKAVTTVLREGDDGVGSVMRRGDDSVRVPRGNGVWLVRQHPFDVVNGTTNAVPFWVYGQSVTNAVETAIRPGPGGTYSDGSQKAYSTVLGNPYGVAMRVNDMTFVGEILGGGVQGDCIVVPSGTSAEKRLYRGLGDRPDLWCCPEVRLVKGRPRTHYDYEVTVPAGLAFWYERRGTGPLKIVWPYLQEKVESNGD